MAIGFSPMSSLSANRRSSSRPNSCAKSSRARSLTILLRPVFPGLPGRARYRRGCPGAYLGLAGFALALVLATAGSWLAHPWRHAEAAARSLAVLPLATSPTIPRRTTSPTG